MDSLMLQVIGFLAVLVVMLAMQAQPVSWRAKPALLRYGLHGPTYIRALVLLMVAFDRLRGILNLNLGRFPMSWKVLYMRVLLYQFGSVGSDEQIDAAMNRAQRRHMYFNVAKRMRYAYYLAGVCGRSGDR